jgi:hypothetical protein
VDHTSLHIERERDGNRLAAVASKPAKGPGPGHLMSEKASCQHRTLVDAAILNLLAAS